MTTQPAPQCATLWSPEQQRFFLHCEANPNDSVFLNAVAGSGKTTTAVEFAKRTPTSVKTIFLSFSKDIAKTFKARLPYWVEGSTFNSLGNTILGQHFGKKSRADARKCAGLLRTLVPNYSERREIEDDVLTLVSRAKSQGYLCPGFYVQLDEIADRFNIDAGPLMFELVEEILFRCTQPPFDVIDFDDQLWLVLMLNAKCPRVHTAVVDEAQDTNSVQREILRRMLQPWREASARTRDGIDKLSAAVVAGLNKMQGNGGRLIAVGDPNQSIYGFRGADSDAIGSLVSDFNMTELPLSVSWRCSKAVVEEARKYLAAPLTKRRLTLEELS